VTGFDAKADLLDYLQGARETLLWKLDGLGEYDIRRPLTPTGTNLLGLVKHQAGGELIYFGDIFGRPHGEHLPWWGEDTTTTLGRILVHMTAETQRHAGHADIVRELIDGSVGLLEDSSNMTSDDPAWWRDYCDQVERAAQAAGSAGR
jgi:hypothetical protein